MKASCYAALIYILMCHHLSAYASNSSDCGETDCINVGEWELGVAIGIGARSNPLVDGDVLPLIVLPDIAYYGESFYFDNFEIGYQLLPSNNQSVEVFVKPNTERAYFSFWHPDNVLLTFTSSPLDGPSTPTFPTIPGVPNEPTKPVQKEISVDDVSKRDWAIDAGIRWQYYQPSYRLSAFINTDVSGVYKGTNGGVNVAFPWRLNEWQFTSSLGAVYKSTALTNYYYGISIADTKSKDTFQAKGGWQYSFNTSASYQFSDSWQILLRFEITQLHSGMYNSPLVKDKQVTSVFSGFVYRF